MRESGASLNFNFILLPSPAADEDTLVSQLLSSALFFAVPTDSN